MKFQTFSFLTTEYYYIHRTPDMLIAGEKFTKDHKKVLQELFKQITKAHFSLPNHTLDIIFPKDIHHRNYIQINVLYEADTNTFHIQSIRSDIGKQYIYPAKDRHVILMEDFSFDEKMDALEIRRRRVKYARLLRRVGKRRGRLVFRAHFYTYPSGDLLDDSAIISAENIIIETSKKRKEERKREAEERQKQQREQMYAARYAQPKIFYHLGIRYEDKNYEIRKTRHLYHKRNGKARIDGFSDEMLKKLFLSVLEYGEILRYKRFVLIFPKDGQKSNYYSMLIDFSPKKNRFTIITIFLDDTRYRKLFHFPQEKNAVYLDNISFESLRQM